MLGHAVLAEEGGVLQLCHAGREFGQVKIGAVGGGLEGSGGGGQAAGAATQVAAAPAVHLPAPAADVHPLAVIDQKSRGYQVGASAIAPAAKRRTVEAGGEVLVQLLNKLCAVGRGVEAQRSGVLSQRLAQ